MRTFRRLEYLNAKYGVFVNRLYFLEDPSYVQFVSLVYLVKPLIYRLTKVIKIYKQLSEMSLI